MEVEVIGKLEYRGRFVTMEKVGQQFSVTHDGTQLKTDSLFTANQYFGATCLAAVKSWESTYEANVVGQTLTPIRQDSKLDMAVQDLNVSVRYTNCLIAQNVYTVGELLKVTRSSLSKDFPNLGRAGIGKIEEALSKLGFQLKP